MAEISFKAKALTMYNTDDTVAYQYLAVPQFDRKHCDMAAFRCHPKYGSYANSDLFKGMLSRIRRDVFKDGILRLDAVPTGVSVDTSGFIAVVSLEV